MGTKNTTSGYPTSNPEDDDEQDTRDDTDDLYTDSFRIKHNGHKKSGKAHPDRVGKYTKKFR